MGKECVGSEQFASWQLRSREVYRKGLGQDMTFSLSPIPTQAPMSSNQPYLLISTIPIQRHHTINLPRDLLDCTNPHALITSQ